MKVDFRFVPEMGRELFVVVDDDDRYVWYWSDDLQAAESKLEEMEAALGWL